MKRILFVAHPDDDILFFGNLEILGFFDLKIVLTFKKHSFRAGELVEWTFFANSSCDVIFLENEDFIFRDKSILIDQLSKYIDEGDIVFTHGPSGEYGHIQHILCYEAIAEGFPNVIVNYPVFPPSTKAEQVIVGDKTHFVKKYYGSQFSVLEKRFGANFLMDCFDIKKGD